MIRFLFKTTSSSCAESLCILTSSWVLVIHCYILSRYGYPAFSIQKLCGNTRGYQYQGFDYALYIHGLFMTKDGGMPILKSLILNNDDTRLINLPSPPMFDLGSDVYKSACLPMSLLAFLFFSFFLCKFQCILLSIQSTFKVRCSGWEV